MEANQPGTCATCQRLFHGSSSMKICPECEQKLRIPSSRVNVSTRRQTQNIYLPVYESSLSSPFNTNGSLSIYCPHCKNINLMNHVIGNFTYYCAVCHNIIPVTYHQ